jgi:hypothetical protein
MNPPPLLFLLEFQFPRASLPTRESLCGSILIYLSDEWSTSGVTYLRYAHWGKQAYSCVKLSREFQALSKLSSADHNFEKHYRIFYYQLLFVFVGICLFSFSIFEIASYPLYLIFRWGLMVSEMPFDTVQCWI